VPTAASSAWSGGGAGWPAARRGKAQGLAGPPFIGRGAAPGVRRTHAEGGPAAARLARPALAAGLRWALAGLAAWAKADRSGCGRVGAGRAFRLGPFQ
jgi:hypothetical protein